MDRDKFTPTEQAMLCVLADGRPHTRAELHACLPDDLAALSSIQRHISELRRKLHSQKQDIICEMAPVDICYRHV